MVTDAEIRRLSVPEKMFSYADSYLRGALALCEVLAQSVKCTWADGSVVLMMSAHATELMLKGMLLKRMPAQDVWKLSHDLQKLSDEYRAQFPESEFEWEVPFRKEYPSDMTAEEIAQLAPLRDAPPSILFRYPVNTAGQDWRGLYGFEPNSFIPVLRRMNIDFDRLRSIAV